MAEMYMEDNDVDAAAAKATYRYGVTVETTTRMLKCSRELFTAAATTMVADEAAKEERDAVVVGFESMWERDKEDEGVYGDKRDGDGTWRCR